MSVERFRTLARGLGAPGGLVPVWRDVLLDLDTPVTAFARLRRGPFAFLLESAPAGGETWARYTFMGTEPASAWRLVDGAVEEWTPEAGWHGRRTPADPIADLDALVRARRPADVPELGAFWAGAVGYFAYDVVRHVERLPSPPPRTLATPDALWVFTRCLVILDNLRSTARVVCAVPVRGDEDDRTLELLHRGATEEIDALELRLQEPSPLRPLRLDPDAPPATGSGRLSREAFMDGVARIKEYIAAGDCFQSLIARRVELAHDFDTTSLYRALRALNPSPYMYHLALDGVELVGCSPELLVRVAERRATVRPIAGTRPRGRTAEEDAEMEAELVADAKERAEHVMLVDLGRNDVGRVARFGSVKVTELMRVERYSHVFHLVSQVEGELADGMTSLDVVRAAFPAGTMTGAPKVRAMEIIDELEPERRGPYAGALGYIAAGGDRMDLAITIRTCVVAGGVASVQAGAGIVADSVPELEWAETENKMRAVLTAIGRVRGAEAAGTRPDLDHG